MHCIPYVNVGFTFFFLLCCNILVSGHRSDLSVIFRLSFHMMFTFYASVSFYYIFARFFVCYHCLYRDYFLLCLWILMFHPTPASPSSLPVQRCSVCSIYVAVVWMPSPVLFQFPFDMLPSNTTSLSFIQLDCHCQLYVQAHSTGFKLCPMPV